MRHSLKCVTIKYVPNIKIRMPVGSSLELKILRLTKNLSSFKTQVKPIVN